MMVFGRPQFVLELDEELLELEELGAEPVNEHGEDVVFPAKFVFHLSVYHGHRKIHHLHGQQRRQGFFSCPADLT